MSRGKRRVVGGRRLVWVGALWEFVGLPTTALPSSGGRGPLVRDARFALGVLSCRSTRIADFFLPPLLGRGGPGCGGTPLHLPSTRSIFSRTCDRASSLSTPLIRSSSY